MSTTPCAWAGCQNEAATHGGRKEGLCWAHYKRRQRGQPLGRPLAEFSSSPWAAVLKASLAYAESDAGDDQEWERAQEKLRKAVHRYMQSLPLFRGLLEWVGQQEQFRRGALRQLKRQPPIPSLNYLKWVGPKAMRELKEALRR